MGGGQSKAVEKRNGIKGENKVFAQVNTARSERDYMKIFGTIDSDIQENFFHCVIHSVTAPPYISNSFLCTVHCTLPKSNGQ